jgi:predicted site-specific integrase-resolvase
MLTDEIAEHRNAGVCCRMLTDADVCRIIAEHRKHLRKFGAFSEANASQEAVVSAQQLENRYRELVFWEPGTQFTCLTCFTCFF